MRQPVIDSENENLEFNMYGADFLKYEGNLFTGTVIFNDTNPASFTEYKNGNQDGKSVSYYLNGKLEEECIYSDGEYIEGKHWYQNGQLRNSSDNEGICWDEDGTIIRENNFFLYKSGNKRYGKNIDGDGIYYSSKGEIAIKIIFANTESNINKTIFYNKVLIESYNELMDNIYINPDDNFNFRNRVKHYINSWIIKLYNRNHKTEAIDIINQIIKDSEIKIREEGLNFKIKQQEENNIRDSKRLLQRILNDEFDDTGKENPDEYTKLLFD